MHGHVHVTAYACVHVCVTVQVGGGRGDRPAVTAYGCVHVCVTVQVGGGRGDRPAVPEGHHRAGPVCRLGR